MLDMVPRIESVTPDEPIADDDSKPLITAHEGSLDWLVLTEDGNTEGWLATQLAVDVRDYR